MNKLKGISFKGYKSFSSEEYNSLNEIKNVNVIIGKNNCGKSSVIDILENIIVFNNFKYNLSEQIIKEINIAFKITETEIRVVFPPNQTNYNLKVHNVYSYGKQLVGHVINSKMLSKGTEREFVYAGNQEEIFKNYEKDGKNYLNNLANVHRSFFDNYKFRRLNAERDIVIEKLGSMRNIDNNGNGATEIIRLFQSDRNQDESLIDNLLKKLNKITNPDSVYSEIKTKTEDSSNEYEIFLKEDNGKSYPLSKCGSGLKTIILVLLNLLIIPEMEEYKGKRIVFAFEELENNLHPALQRRLFKFIYDYAVEKDISIFLTTHSHVAINFFSSKDKAEHSQIFHVVKNKNISSIQTVNNYIDKIKILEDLDVRASDLFQSNGIIWVEGPSDRIYIKKWLELFCDCKYEENSHYQFLYYGGKLLSHYTTENEVKDLINILTTNHNSAIVIDSDKTKEEDTINNTKERIKNEFKSKELFCWITKGKEIENYLSVNAIKLALNIENLSQCEQYELFPKYIDKVYNNFSSKKVDFANKVKDSIKKENAEILDLKEKIENLYKQIQKWNNDLENKNE